jgi:hypothetical protein
MFQILLEVINMEDTIFNYARGLSISSGPPQGTFGPSSKFILGYVTCTPCKSRFLLFKLE